MDALDFVDKHCNFAPDSDDPYGEEQNSFQKNPTGENSGP